jgi:site-specific DNA-methyltransferase (adenine-specific)
MDLPVNQIICGDCLEVMPLLPDKSIDMILCDLPYGTTACKWDTIIPFKPLWEQYERIIKDNRAIILTASQPFTTKLIESNFGRFKYELIWDKTFGRQPQLANIQPMKRHENILVFGKGRILYNPQKTPLKKPYKSSGAGNNAGTKNDHQLGLKKVAKEYTEKTPDSVLQFKPHSNRKTIHPTQKPVALFEYLIKTYTNEGDIVLDNCIGSGTTAIAALNTGRFFIGIEKEEKYVEIARKRIAEHTQQLSIV